ncbi:hypothetical protein ACFFQW_46480 [Umezawaea endophytica]|uniref:Uncharacterized protein n=1 Tax=Umezawaea endophytica TaxID=1654476 RepID=A0A9X2VVV6_9PSEU|nr:hypothetical protein [Umezawaea endophytica]MCS7483786.1 hypothetical protein [Umezawaea endophytica]
MKVKFAAGLLVPVLFVLVTGCGGGDSGSKVASVSGSPSSGQDKPKGANLDPVNDDKLREYAKCMRDNGIDMPDPKDGVMQAIPIGEGAEQEKMNKANDACKKFLPNGGEYKEPSQEEKDKMREQAKCMREHGIDMPDPDFTGTGSASGSSLALGDDTKKFEEAAKACGMGSG